MDPIDALLCAGTGPVVLSTRYECSRVITDTLQILVSAASCIPIWSIGILSRYLTDTRQGVKCVENAAFEC